MVQDFWGDEFQTKAHLSGIGWTEGEVGSNHARMVLTSKLLARSVLVISNFLAMMKNNRKERKFASSK